jgi:exodeoxyribonuclease-3
LVEGISQPAGYRAYWHTAQKKGYSGVATLCRSKPKSVRLGFGLPRFDVEGRVLITEHEGFTLMNVYFPNGRRSRERVAYKIEFYDSLLAYCDSLRAQGHRLIVCGDYNTAHQPIDLARPKENQNTSGFLLEERKAFDRWLAGGFVDVYRHLHPESQEYTWWTYRFDARARNIGWRIDYFLVSQDLMSSVEKACILGTVTGSDHCPIELQLRT